MAGAPAFFPEGPKPPWLRINVRTGPHYNKVRNTMRALGLHTVCEEARCPNIFECWSERTGTFMILGDICTRRCGFCAVTTGRPAAVDRDEPHHLAEAVARLGLRHAVVTSVDRDDLVDGGAGHFAAVIKAVRRRNPGCGVEILTPDFRGVDGAARRILPAGPLVFGHNVETVPALYGKVRPGSSFRRSVDLLATVRRLRGAASRPLLKSGLMVGLGETRDALLRAFAALATAGVEILTLGQYLRPTLEHVPVVRYYHPDEFSDLRERALRFGFGHVESGPLVRSSYRARAHARAVGAGGPLTMVEDP